MAFGMEIKRLRGEVPISAEKLADIIGIKAARLRKWEEKDMTPRIEDAQKIEAFFQMNLEQVMNLKSIKKFLIVPRESVMREKNVTYGHRNGQEPAGEKPSGETYLEKRRQKKGLSEPYMVPLIPIKAQAGYARSYSNTDFINKLEVYPILPGIDPRGAVWRYFEVQGDSMEPGLYEADLVLVSMVPPEDWQDIKKGQVYVIVTSEEIMIKLIFPVDKNTWLLKSSNKRHREKAIAVKDIKEVWYYRRHVTNKIKWPQQ